MKRPTANALEQLNQSNQLFLTLFQHGSLSVEVYQPFEQDFQ